MATSTPKTHSIPDAELQEIYAFAVSLGQRAGKILLEGVDKRTGDAAKRTDDGQVDKMNAVDIVTQTDLGKFETLPWFVL
jgi:myo-inositol-1(or 4)-monophosphatase